MKRIDIREIHEQAWLPGLLRDEITDALEVLFGALRAYQPIAPRLREAVGGCRASRFVDLCSGGGGPWLWLQPEVTTPQNGALPVYLTDKFPNVKAFDRAKKLSKGMIDYSPESIDAANLPASLTGFRTIFSSFHHFPPAEAAAMLEDAVAKRQGIGIFEMARRRPRTIIFTFLVPLGALIATPFARPFRLSRLIFTYLIPIIPLVLWIDGTLSCLRAYLPEELSTMCSEINAPGYTWKIGESSAGLVCVTFLLGYPQDSSKAAAMKH
jgi:hypothetical protein